MHDQPLNLHIFREGETTLRVTWTVDNLTDFKECIARWYVKTEHETVFMWMAEDTVDDYGDRVTKTVDGVDYTGYIFSSSYTVPEDALSVEAGVTAVYEWTETVDDHDETRTYQSPTAFIQYGGNPRTTAPAKANELDPRMIALGADKMRVYWNTNGSFPVEDTHFGRYEVRVFEYKREPDGGIYRDITSATLDDPFENTYDFEMADDTVDARAEVRAVPDSAQWEMDFASTDTVANPKITQTNDYAYGTPDAPQVSVSVEDGTAVVTWTCSDERVEKFWVYRLNEGASEWVMDEEVPVTADFRHVHGLVAGYATKFHVAAVSRYGTADDPICSESLDTAWAYREPTAPGNFKAQVLTSLSTSESAAFQLSWAASATRVESYEVQYVEGADFSSSGVQSATLDPDTHYTIDGLEPNVGYSFRVRAANPAGRSAWSSAATGQWAVAPEKPGLEAEYSGGKVVAAVETGNSRATVALRVTEQNGADISMTTYTGKADPYGRARFELDGGAPGSRFSMSATYTVGTKESAASDAAVVERVPAAPTGLSAVAFSAVGDDGAAKVLWADEGSTGDSYELRVANRPTLLTEFGDDVKVLDLDASSVSWSEDDGVVTRNYVVTGLNTTETWYFAMRRKNDAGASAWGTTDGGREYAGVLISTSPDAPSTIRTDRGAYAIGSTVDLEWRHNCADGCTQEAAQVELTVGGSVQTLDVAGSSQHCPWTAAGADGATASWRVRTKGIPEGYSAWSEPRTFTIWGDPKPSLALSDAAGNAGTGMTLQELPLTLSASNAQSRPSGYGNAVVEWAAEITAVSGYTAVGPDGEEREVAAGEVVWRGRAAKGDAGWSASDGYSHSFQVGAADMAFSGSCEASVIAVTAQGMTAMSDAATFTCDLSSTVPKPALSASVDLDAATCELVPSDAGMELSVYRLDSDGAPVLVKGGMASGEAVTDIHPSFGTCTYRVVAVDPSTGKQSYEDFPVEVKANYTLIQWDGGSLKLPWNLQWTEKYSPDAALLAFTGRKDPVAYFGTQLGRTFTASAEVPKGTGLAQVAAIRKLMGRPQEAYVREASGLGFKCVVTSAQVSRSYDSGAVPLQLELSRVV